MYVDNLAFIGETSSIESIEKSEKIDIYPSPVSDILFINLSQLKIHPLLYEIIDIQGKIVKVAALDGSSFQKILVNELLPGIYTLKIHTFHHNVTQKFIKQ